MGTLFNKGDKPEGNDSSTVPQDPMMLNLHAVTTAEQLAGQNYNWDPLAEYFDDFASPEDVSEMLKLVYFEYSRLVILNPEEVIYDSNNLLFQLQKLCLVFYRMGAKEQNRLAIGEK